MVTPPTENTSPSGRADLRQQQDNSYHADAVGYSTSRQISPCRKGLMWRLRSPSSSISLTLSTITCHNHMLGPCMTASRPASSRRRSPRCCRELKSQYHSRTTFQHQHIDKHTVVDGHRSQKSSCNIPALPLHPPSPSLARTHHHNRGPFEVSSAELFPLSPSCTQVGRSSEMAGILYHTPSHTSSLHTQTEALSREY